MIEDNIIHDEYVYIDTETTGLNPNTDEIVEVAAIKFSMDGATIDTFHKYCKPMSGFIPVEASNIHGITIDKVKGEKYYSEIRADLASFIGKRTLIGHNLIGFDINFLKLQPVQMYDTLLMCRKIWPGKNNLGNACKRLDIKFNKDEAHSALYDVKKGVELYLKLMGIKKVNDEPDLFTDPAKVAPTQVYSYSRINSFHTCPFKWKQIYLLKNKEPDQPYFVVGKTMHKIAQISAMWCYMKTFGNKFHVYAQKKSWLAPKELMKLIENDMAKNGLYLPKDVADLTLCHIGMFLYKNSSYIMTFLGKTIIDIMDDINQLAPDGEYEIVSKPDAETYAKIVQVSMALERCIDPDCVRDVAWMSDFFYNQKDYAMSPNEVALVEKQMIFDKDWKPLKNWFDENGYMRGAIDVVEYNGSNHITIIDYKTSRVMLTADQLKHDMQLKIYVLYLHKYMPEISTVTIKHHYMRYGKIVSVDITDVKTAAMEAEAWISESIDMIEREMLKPDSEGFKPCRNKYCSSCFLMESNTCPLFAIKLANDISDPANFTIKSIEDFKKAWKKIEVNEAENKGLTSKCKMYLKNCQGRITIDEKASVDFWAKEKITYSPVEVTKMLTNRGVKLTEILNNCSLSATAIEKILKKNKIELSKEDVDKITSKSTEMQFKALTKEEVEMAGYLNS